MGVPGYASIMSRTHQSKACIIRMLRYTRPAVDRISGADCSVYLLETHNFVRWPCR
jgi:hypothetical protein